MPDGRNGPRRGDDTYRAWVVTSAPDRPRPHRADRGRPARWTEHRTDSAFGGVIARGGYIVERAYIEPEPQLA